MIPKRELLTQARRDFIQRLMLNAFSILFAAAIASNFFTSYPLSGKILIALVMIGSILTGFGIKREG